MILLVSPAAADSTTGNGVTARRWAGFLRELGHQVELSREYRGGGYDALLALHARKSADAIRAFRAGHPGTPVVLALTGTDLYPDLATAGVDPEVLAMADRLVLLQPRGLDQLDPATRERARVIVQSVPPIERKPPRAGCFEVAFLAHLRPVKDPLRPAEAVRELPAGSRIRVTHLGAAQDAELGAAAAAESAANPHYDWLGPRPRKEALDLLARSRLLVLTSRHEGGANVISEALAARLPIVCSAIPGSVGLLGEDYPGYFPVGDGGALARALYDAEQDTGGYYGALREHCASLAGLVDPERERRAWAGLLAELALPASRFADLFKTSPAALTPGS
jgi:putative glycosyltransferase (TIGR04348 family)